MLACVVNVSEGRRGDVIAGLAEAAGDHCLDVHSDPDHHRSVFWLAGPAVEDAARALTTAAVAQLDIHAHQGVHPRIGVVDVVPFVPVDDASTMHDAIAARDAFAGWAREELQLPCFLYGPERSLPDVRRAARGVAGHPTAGACAVGARGPLVAYNLWLAERDLEAARTLAASLRSENVRALALVVGEHMQVSCNLVNPLVVGPAEIYDAVARHAVIARAELVGLIGGDVLDRVPKTRWAQLDIGEERTLEARLP
ncbi:MAG: glutamate formiminotransferase / 5-formyltetrahydrofolate cyclo-ligase [Actinomycetota bacterium]|jgi:glutamate formiminotransferase